MIALALVLALQPAAAAQADPIGAMLAAQEQVPVPESAEPENVDLVEGSMRAQLMAAAPVDFCRGYLREGSLLICRFLPHATVELGDGIAAQADEEGFVTLGIPREAPNAMTLRIGYRLGDGTPGEIVETVHIVQREYDLQHVDGVPQATVTPDPSTLERRQREYAQKQEAFASVWEGRGFLDGFIPPSQGITTGVYGSARVYNDGHEGSPHWGLDWANEIGTPVYAPAGGLVTLAEPDMYYEGGLIFIDHGQGLISAFLHLSGVSVEAGNVVEQGQLIGAMGAGGRATGSHLDWRVKLRNRFYVDPQTLLELDLTDLE